MNLNELVKIQYEFDNRHGWNVDQNNIKDLLKALSSDLIGMIAEVGEFANVLKKISLEENRLNMQDLKSMYEDRQPQLAEELVDAFIYLARICSHMNIDLEKEYLNKLNFNATRYRPYEIDND